MPSVKEVRPDEFLLNRFADSIQSDSNRFESSESYLLEPIQFALFECSPNSVYTEGFWRVCTSVEKSELAFEFRGSSFSFHSNASADLLVFYYRNLVLDECLS